MTQFLGNQFYPGQYFNIPASSSTTVAGLVGAKGDFLQRFVVSYTGTPVGNVTVFDGTTALFTVDAGTLGTTPTAPFSISVEAFSKTGTWNVTTGTNTNVVMIGQFT